MQMVRRSDLVQRVWRLNPPSSATAAPVDRRWIGDTVSQLSSSFERKLRQLGDIGRAPAAPEQRRSGPRRTKPAKAKQKSGLPNRVLARNQQ